MYVMILGGRDDGLSVEIPDDIGEGQRFIVNGSDYFFNRPKNKSPKLIYYTSSRE